MVRVLHNPRKRHFQFTWEATRIKVLDVLMLARLDLLLFLILCIKGKDIKSTLSVLQSQSCLINYVSLKGKHVLIVLVCNAFSLSGVDHMDRMVCQLASVWPGSLTD